MFHDPLLLGVGDEERVARGVPGAPEPLEHRHLAVARGALHDEVRPLAGFAGGLEHRRVGGDEEQGAVGALLDVGVQVDI